MHSIKENEVPRAGFSHGPGMLLRENFPHRRFEEHARNTPDAVAVVHEAG